MLLYAPPKPNSSPTANIIRLYDRFTTFRPPVGKPAHPHPPHAKSLAQLAVHERPHSPECQIYIPDGCMQVAGDPAYW
jgi:hypothetical protein